ncbi:hypothetical protein HY772_06580 [Candidatus Woesearchaeota archaeon]|nr:hypothetical protein [Candidatus Woesearchaeota archaeon]
MASRKEFHNAFIYTPLDYPKESTILITIIVIGGIFGTIFIHEIFLFSALMFWLLYTAILTYLQFKEIDDRKKAEKEQERRRWLAKGYSAVQLVLLEHQTRPLKISFQYVTDLVKNPLSRLFVFAYISSMAVFAARQGDYIMGYLGLAMWWLFAINFYFVKNHRSQIGGRA